MALVKAIVSRADLYAPTASWKVVKYDSLPLQTKGTQEIYGKRGDSAQGKPIHLVGKGAV